MDQTNDLVTGLIAGLTSDHKEAATPCDEWTVHDLINHMCGGAHLVAAGLEGEAVPGGLPTDMPDFLLDGPATGWKAATDRLALAVTSASLTSTFQFPFGETPGDVALAVITADHVTHAWDLAHASEQSFEISDELAEFALKSWLPVLPAEGRSGPGFKAAILVSDNASALDKLVAYTGRQP